MFKKAIIAVLAVSALGTGVALADSDGDDEEYGYGDCAPVYEEQMGGHSDDNDGGYGHDCEDEDDDEHGSAMNAAPAGSVPPPANGLINPDSTPSVRVQ